MSLVCHHHKITKKNTTNGAVDSQEDDEITAIIPSCALTTC